MKIRRLITILSALTLTCIAGCGKAGNMEAFTDVQAYRTAIDLDFEYQDETDPAICVDPPGTGNPEELKQEAFKAFEIINEARVSENLAQLRWDAKLETCSNIRAEELLSRFDHVCPDGRSWFMVAQDTVLGENIYKGKKSADKVMESWMNNPTDKKNFMCDYFTKA
ncbi:MAG: CAP domain-containing protein, partial [Lachnospiraceae bacterium]|nr:CAP domain-containing protein [Lachnospiraceae bacterium]